jgi:hypothetical protein
MHSSPSWLDMYLCIHVDISAIEAFNMLKLNIRITTSKWSRAPMLTWNYEYNMKRNQKCSYQEWNFKKRKKIQMLIHSNSSMLHLVVGLLNATFAKLKKKTPWPESASELHRPSDRHLSAKLAPTSVDRGCHVVSVTDLYGRILGFLDWICSLLKQFSIKWEMMQGK